LGIAAYSADDGPAIGSLEKAAFGGFSGDGGAFDLGRRAFGSD
jgi:hypothetical protein